MTPIPARVRFDEAAPLALDIARDIAAEGFDVLLVRDVLGRFSVVVDDREASVDEGRRERWTAALAGLGAYATSRPLAFGSRLFSTAELLRSARVVSEASESAGSRTGSVRLRNNTVVGEDWAKVSTPGPEPDGTRTHRTALYGFKGGVGRTTATAVLARHLADQDKIVLVVDLDLESPGIGPLLAGGGLPASGIVDHLVESAVGNADNLELVTRTSYTPRSGFGELWVAPARGQGVDGVPYAYAEKLNRVYADTPGASFADRLADAVRACEEAVKREGDSDRRPDVVLLDSRAGIHDVAAVAISRLCDLALLFGADNAQTWTGYGDLFAAWQSSGQAREIRDKLRMVASMVPDSVHHTMDDYLDAFRSRSYDCFRATLYDEVVADEAGADPDPVSGRVSASGTDTPFSPAEEDDAAPHHPIPILFDPGLVGMDALNSPRWQDRAFVQAAYRDFLATATPLILSAPDGGGSDSGSEEGTA
ncbi:KGGVGR-motif variant AAA ATPase [Streptomyces lycii]|uniref:AAA family ATPase n=1 Tax=Streptomyces lycii TaxID=2654337 RepID=A0ABQ7FAM3_9ACTN|nr:AAA family ATPase [Streptomyces lycii]KAF4405359.1 AAA family ATPase [Streptomyces lycii]